MVTVYVYKQQNYAVKTPKIKSVVRSFFQKEGIVSKAFVSIAFVNERKMLDLAKKYYKDTKLHNVFSFVEKEAVNFVNPLKAGINLGEIVVCYPQAVREAVMENKLVETKIIELLLHAGSHLMGRHHKE